MSQLASSLAEVWHLKQIYFRSQPVKIITQNFNGPCSFIAICNILILRGQIEILPHGRTTVSYEFLSQLVGEYLLLNCPDIDISAALSIMPTTTKGLDLNPQFTRITAFSPVSDAGELDLFARAGIQLVHGWVVDPNSPEAAVMTHIRDYDTAVTLIADADYITKGRLLGCRDEATTEGDTQMGLAGPSASSSSRLTSQGAMYSDEEQHKIEQAIVSQQFLDATKSQLTYHGLFQLASTLEPGSLVALFRNAHLSVVYKSFGPSVPPTASPSTSDTDAPTEQQHHPESALYALVTDDAFLHEPSIVWERLEDVDGGWSTFVDSDFHVAVPVGGDVAGQTAEGALRRMEGGDDLADRELARQLQAEEDEHARKVYQQQLERRRAEEQAQASRGDEAVAGAAGEERRWRRSRVPGGSRQTVSKGKHKQCVVM